MSLISALLAIVLFFSGFAVAQITAPKCSSTWEWSFNSLGQDPCLITAYMSSTCNGGSYDLIPLPSGYHYEGPSGIDNSDLCKCNTVRYSLISACGGCQGERWITWSEYVFNCTKVLPPSSFPNPIPSGTRVPQWALLDVTNENDWDFNRSYAVGGSPELGPGTIIGPSSSSVSSSSTSNIATSSTDTSSKAASSTAPPILAGRHSSNVGAIAGGIAGGVATTSVLAVTLLFYLRRRRSKATSAPFIIDDSVSNPRMDQAQWSMSGQETVTSLPGTSASMMKHYNPDDPTTFPAEYQAVPNLPNSARLSSLSSSKSLYTTATIPNSTAQEYHGLRIA